MSKKREVIKDQIKKIVRCSQNRKYSYWNVEFSIQTKKQISYSWEEIAGLEDRALGSIQSGAQRVQELENLKERRCVKCKKS